jgi:cytochrome c553
MKKKLLLAGVPIAIVLLLVLLGPPLLDFYRLDRFISLSSKSAEVTGGPWPRLTDVCTGCHGINGNSMSANYPSLAGQPATYIVSQLTHFADGQRVNPTMGPLAMTLTEAEIKRLSERFASQRIEGTSFATDVSSEARGKQLVGTGACTACHGEGFLGHDPYPRLAGQGYGYLVQQFEEFAAGRRSEVSGTMKSISLGASPADREAMAHYLASLPAHTP